LNSEQFDKDKTESFTILTHGTEVSHYRVVRRIGSGGMGEVYLAEDIDLGRQVALKFLLPKFSFDEKYRMRFEHEARATAKLNHPNIITVYEIGKFEDRPFFSMEYITGRSLYAIMKAGILPLSEVVDYSLQICEGLKEAHAAGIIHRDLKPGNMMITETGRVKILDFGLAQDLSADSVDEKGRIEGTLLYMSPEQVSGAELSFGSDIFSFGIVFYELCTGHRPFGGIDSTMLMYSILHEDPRPPNELNPELPKWISPMLLKLLSKDPADRFENMKTVIDYLRTAPKSDEAVVGVLDFRRPRKKVTVIDLRNLSGDQSWGYFCEGFTEDLIREISRRTDLIISAEPAGTQTRNIAEVFARCRSDFVITGSLMKWQDSMKLSINIHGNHGENLVFGEDYEGSSKDLFKILASAAKGASDILANSSGSSPIKVDECLEMNVSAYDYYLKGRGYYHTNKPEDMEFAEKMFNKALDLDPHLALAHTGLSDLHTSYYMNYFDRSPERMEMARLAALKALEMNSYLPEAHRSLGRYYMFSGELENAEKSFLRAIEISPKYAVGFRTIAWLKDMQGDVDNALIWAKKALELSPTDLETLLLISLLYLYMRKFTLAMATLKRAIELGPDYGRAYYILGIVYMKLGLPDLALQNFQQAIKYEGDPNSYIQTGYTHLIDGDFDLAIRSFGESIEKGYLAFVAYYLLGLTYKMLGDSCRAEECFQSTIDNVDEAGKKDPGNICMQSYKCMAYAGMGKKEIATGLLKELEGKCERHGDVLYNIARCYALLGDKKQSDEFKRKAIKEHAGPTEKELNLDPHFLL